MTSAIKQGVNLNTITPLDPSTLDRKQYQIEEQTRAIPLDLLRVDWTYQRRKTDQAVTRLVNDFKWWALGVIYVNKRDDGFYYVMDGQHRLAVVSDPRVRDVYGITSLNAQVFSGLTVDQEAAVFLYLNHDRARVTTRSLVRALLQVDSPEGDRARVMKSIIESEGFRLVFEAKDKVTDGIQALWACMSILDRGESDSYLDGGQGLLHDVLRTIKYSWTDEQGVTSKDALKGQFIEGLAIFYAATYPLVRVGEARAKFAGFTASRVWVNGVGRAETLTSASSIGIAEELVSLYNYRRGYENRIPATAITSYLDRRRARGQRTRETLRQKAVAELQAATVGAGVSIEE